MKIGDLVQFNSNLNLRDAGKGLIIGVRENETYVYWQNESRCSWVMAEWLKVLI
jgi:hypothetical protein